MVLAPFKLRCCDIAGLKVKQLNGYDGNRTATLSYRESVSRHTRNTFHLELIAKHDVRAACSDLVINVKPAGYSLFPVVRPALFHNEVNRLCSTPSVEDRLFVQEDVASWCADRGFLPGILINKKEFAVQIKNKADDVVNRPLE